MNKPEIVGHLRRVGLWSVLARWRRHLVSPICRVIHGAVLRFGSSKVLPTNLVLKHTFDYRVLFVNPNDIRLILKSGAWRKDRSKRGLLVRLGSWYHLGGGWKSVNSHLSRNFYGSFIADGNWDLDARPMSVLPVIDELFRGGLRPDQTELYRKQVRKIENRDVAWARGQSVEELERYFQNLKGTYDRMKHLGYKTQAELGQQGLDEIRVCIDRKGRMAVFGGGTHRLSMAKLLELERVPVILKRVHQDWVLSWMAETKLVDPVAAIEVGVKGLMNHDSRIASNDA
jgi:hypothetical protein